MAPFRAPGEDEYQGSEFLPAAEDTYRVRIDGYKIVDKSPDQYNKDPWTQVQFRLIPLFIEGDEEALMVDTENEELAEDKFFIFFFDPRHLGLKPVVAKSRKFLSAALNVPVEQPVEAASLEAFADSLVGRELIVEVGLNKKGTYNTVTDSRPIQVKTRKRKAAPQESLVAVAEEVFNTESEGEDEEY